MNELALRTSFPEIAWSEPVMIVVVGKPTTRWVCRYCIALHGIEAARIEEVPFAFDTPMQATHHIRGHD